MLIIRIFKNILLAANSIDDDTIYTISNFINIVTLQLEDIAMYLHD